MTGKVMYVCFNAYKVFFKMFVEYENYFDFYEKALRGFQLLFLERDLFIFWKELQK